MKNQIARRYIQRRSKRYKTPLAASEAILIEMMELTADGMRYHADKRRFYKNPGNFLKFVGALLDQTQALAKLEQQPGFVPQASAMQPPATKSIYVHIIPKLSEAPALVPKGAIVDVQAVRQITGGSDAKE